jgi:hypothetical protein
MKTVLVAAAGAVAVATLTAFSWVVPTPRRHASPFAAVLAGDVSAEIWGDATFSRVLGGVGAPTVFTLNLGQDNTRGTILFTRMSSARLGFGSYAISDRWDGSDDIHAVVLVGPALHPTGVFRAQSGRLTISSASDSVLTGSFIFEASGFTSAAPDNEDQRVAASGSFRAKAK